MESALIVTHSPKSVPFFADLLHTAFYKHITVVKSGAEARQLLFSHNFDLVIIDSPLRDEAGESLSIQIARKGVGQVILVVNAAFFDAISSKTENDGILTIQRPINKTLFWSLLKLANAVQNRVNDSKKDNRQLSQQIEDIRIIDRAKHALMSLFEMEEHEAHRYIEKQAMDMRITKRAVAEGILKMYEN